MIATLWRIANLAVLRFILTYARTVDDAHLIVCMLASGRFPF